MTPVPEGPKGQKRPADVIGNAITVAKFATGEIEETLRRRQGQGRASLGPEGRQGPRGEDVAGAAHEDRAEGGPQPIVMTTKNRI